MTAKFLQVQHNVHSQCGEDGIIEWLLAELGLATGTFVEFGAWDGKHLSNTRLLVERNWGGLYIEARPKRFEVLRQEYAENDKIKTLCRWVRPEGPDALDALIEEAGLPNIDLFSIDIDSDDLAVWKGVKKHRGKIIVIEYNSVIPFDTRYENTLGQTQGNSALSTYEYAISTGYRLVAGTQANLIFVDEKICPDSLPAITLQQVKDSINTLRVAYGFDGSQLIEEMGDPMQVKEAHLVPWTTFVAFSPLPKIFRGFDVWVKTRLLFALFEALTRRPFQFGAVWKRTKERHRQ